MGFKTDANGLDFADVPKRGFEAVKRGFEDGIEAANGLVTTGLGYS